MDKFGRDLLIGAIVVAVFLIIVVTLVMTLGKEGVHGGHRYNLYSNRPGKQRCC